MKNICGGKGLGRNSVECYKDLRTRPVRCESVNRVRKKEGEKG